MKKIILAAAIVCAAVGARAGYANWNMYDIMDPDAGYAYLFNSADIALATAADVSASIAAGTFATVYAANAIADTDFADGEISYAKAYSGTGSTTLWVIALDDDANPTKFFIGEEVTQTLASSSAMKPFEWTYDDNTSVWTPVGGSPIPEPTSGLLLLLGVAGLTLKRKRV